MRRIFLSLLLSTLCLGASAQDQRPFKARIYNAENSVYLQLDLYEHRIIVPGQELFGELHGFLGDEKDGRKWLIVDATIENDKTATLTIVNDYGSEDLTATLAVNADGTYTFKQGEGSTIKIARNRKYVRLPKTLVFTTTKAAK